MSRQLAEVFTDFRDEKCPKDKLTREQKRVAKHLLDFLRKPEVEKISEIDFYIDKSTGDKLTLVQMVQDFYEWYEGKYKTKVETDIWDRQPIDVPLLRRIEIVKYLQKPGTTEDIARHFCVSDQTVRGDLRALRKEISILGIRFSVEEETTGRNRKKYYKSTAHPILLMLNLTEIKALLTELEELSREKDTDLFSTLSDRIKEQLTQYAREKVCREEQAVQPSENAYRNEEEMVTGPNRNIYAVLTYAFKAGEPCDVCFTSGGRNYEFKGAGIRWEGGDVYTVIPANGEPYHVSRKNFTYACTENYR